MKFSLRIMVCLLVAALVFSACSTKNSKSAEALDSIRESRKAALSGKENNIEKNVAENAGAKSSTSSKANQRPIKAVLLLSSLLGDKAYNDADYKGLQKAADDYGVEVKVLQSLIPAEWEENFVSACAGDYDLVVAGSADLSGLVEKYAPQYPDKKIVLVDGVVKEKNVLSTMFAQNEGSFLAGAAAAMFTTRTDLPNVNPDKVIGWIGGSEDPVLEDFYVGYEQGAKYIDPDIKILKSFAGTYNDADKGKALALDQYNQGADIIMNVASGTGKGIFQAAKETGKYAIGVDQDQDGEAPGHILTSMIKRTDSATFLAAKSVVEGTFKGNSTLYLDLASRGVELTDMSVMKNALGDKFPKEILDKVNELKLMIVNGELKVNSYGDLNKS